MPYPYDDLRLMAEEDEGGAGDDDVGAGIEEIEIDMPEDDYTEEA